jgi:hypothetical protein
MSKSRPPIGRTIQLTRYTEPLKELTLLLERLHLELPAQPPGKEHRYYNIVEKRRVARGTVDRHILYLGEIDDS